MYMYMKVKKIPYLLIAILIVCGLFLMACKEHDCVGDGNCYVNRSNERKKCGDKSCIAYKDVLFTNNETRKNCDCY
jgi:hypothetical protein